MISRPLVSATLGGAVLGDPVAGLLVGAVLELIDMRHLPLGASRYPDTGPAGVVAGASAAAAAGPAGLGVSALLGWTVGWLGARTVSWLRSLNAKLVAGPRASELALRPVRLERRHRLAVALDGVRGAVVAGALLVPAVALVRVVPPVESGTGWLVAVLGLVGALATGGGAAAGTLSGDRRDALLVALGAAGMLLLTIL